MGGAKYPRIETLEATRAAAEVSANDPKPGSMSLLRRL